jgi:hypothetical protein
MPGGIHTLRLLFPFLFLLFLFKTVSGQDSGFGSWNIINLKYMIDDRWSLFGEAQLRSLQFYDDFHYHEFKAGAEVKLHPGVHLALAAGKYDTYGEGGNFVHPKNNEEFRLWPQLVILQSFGILTTEQRYRTEMRFTSNGYRNRFRYRFGVSVPFGNEGMGYKLFQLNASNELFFTDKEPYFERNRFLLSLNYKFSNPATLQLGYLHQFDYKINDESGKNFLVIGVYFDISQKQRGKPINETDLKDY